MKSEQQTNTPKEKEIQEIANEAKDFNKELFALQNERIDYVLTLTIFRYEWVSINEIDLEVLEAQ